MKIATSKCFKPLQIPIQDGTTTAKSVAALDSKPRQPPRPDISHFDSLPNAALIAINEMAAVMGKGVSSAWRDIKSDPDFPQPIRLSAGCTRFNVGDIRGYLTKKVSMSAKPVRNQRLKGRVAA